MARLGVVPHFGGNRLAARRRLEDGRCQALRLHDHHCCWQRARGAVAGGRSLPGIAPARPALRPDCVGWATAEGWKLGVRANKFRSPKFKECSVASLPQSFLLEPTADMQKYAK